jgi:alcohol dehydrogenase class IV
MSSGGLLEPLQARLVAPSYIMVGASVINGLYELATLLNINSIILVYDSATALHIAEGASGALRSLGLRVYEYRIDSPCNGRGHSVEDVEEVVELVAEAPEGIVASLGSPCTICTVKLAKVRYHRPSLDLGSITPVTSLGTHWRPPVHVAVPVGAAMGREADGLARAWSRDGSIVALNKELVSEAVIVDPSLTSGFRPAEAFDSLLDLVTHTFEAVATTLASPLSRDYALLALRRLARILPLIGSNGQVPVNASRLWFEGSMMSLYTGMAVASSGVSLTCALAIATQEEFPSLSHGATSAAYLPHIIRLYEEQDSAVPWHFEELLREAGLIDPGSGDVRPSEAVADLIARIGGPTSLSSLGLSREVVEEKAAVIARKALRLGASLNPLSLDASRLERLVLQAVDPGRSPPSG